MPSLYTGDLFQYQNQNGTWVKTKKLKGYVARKKAFTRLDDPENRPSNAVSIRAGFNHYAGIVHNESLGIFEMQDGNLVHFTVIQFDDRRVFGVELFDPAGTLVGYGTLTGFEMPEDAQRLPITVSWKDQQDRFYLIDYFGYPVVRVVKLAYKPATGQRAGQAAGA